MGTARPRFPDGNERCQPLFRALPQVNRYYRVALESVDIRPAVTPETWKRARPDVRRFMETIHVRFTVIDFNGEVVHVVTVMDTIGNLPRMISVLRAQFPRGVRIVTDIALSCQ